MIKERISRLRELMNKESIDALIVPSEDYHQSEYVSDYFKARAYITGFTGSYGIAVITQEEAKLWTDGRYFIQANQQLKDTGVDLMKIGVEGVPSPLDYLADTLDQGATLAVDGRTLSLTDGLSYEQLMADKDGQFIYTNDWLDPIWTDRPSVSNKPAFELEIEQCGESRASKLQRLRQAMADLGADYHIISALDDNGWLFNLRGDDVKYSHLVLCYSLITPEGVILYIDQDKLSDRLQAELTADGIAFKPYQVIYEDLQTLPNEAKLLLDPAKLNYTLYQMIDPELTIIEAANPCILFKAIKNEIELENMRDCGWKDSVAVTKFMHWCKETIKHESITEWQASEQLVAFRQEWEDYLSPSFAPICAYGSNAAIVHYETTKQNNRELEAKSFFLNDTGANFSNGTTDITRTFAMGPLTDEEIFHYTLVLKSHINLSLAKFIEGTSGFTLDMLARQPLWEHGLNYNHGTGHGVGFLLNVHEGPSGLRYQIIPSKNETHPFEVGMIITNEPGIYIEDKHGIRLEDDLEVVFNEETDFGRFLSFDSLNLVPFDKDAIDVDLLTPRELAYLNEYHQQVYEKVSPQLDQDQKDWLKDYTQPLGE